MCCLYLQPMCQKRWVVIVKYSKWGQYFWALEWPIFWFYDLRIPGIIIIVLPTNRLIQNNSPDSSNNKKFSLNQLILKSANNIITFHYFNESFQRTFFVSPESYAYKLLRKKLSSMKKPLRGMYYIIFYGFCMVLFSER